MNCELQHLYSARQTQAIDSVAIEKAHLDGLTLMKRAGLAAFRFMRWKWPRARRVVVFTGGGNNGGDGYVLAELALRSGLEVMVVPVTDPKSDTARAAAADYRQAGGTLQGFREGDRYSGDVFVDALLGTGLVRDVTGAYAAVIETLNKNDVPVLSMDVPSGLNGDTGDIWGSCVRADATVTFIGRKLGCFTGGGPGFCGSISFQGLEVPSWVYDTERPAATLINPGSVALPRRSALTHKGDSGRVLLVGGNHGMGGAVMMSAQACHRSGAGLVFVGTRPENAPGLLNLSYESMFRNPDSDQTGAWNESCDVVAIGPGLGQDEWARRQWQRAVDRTVPMVVDADALNLLAQNPVTRDDWVLTPHPGEAARLLNTSIGEVQQDRAAAAREIQNRYGGVVVLKGAGSLVRGDTLRICDLGNPGMASAGMGDVLTGVLAAIIAQGLSHGKSIEDCAAYAVWIHSRAGDLAADPGQVGVTAGAVIDKLPMAVAESTGKSHHEP